LRLGIIGGFAVISWIFGPPKDALLDWMAPLMALGMAYLLVGTFVYVLKEATVPMRRRNERYARKASRNL
jgi:hypothetical protein